ncbi:alpha/beta hydrolase family protein [Streptomyces avicenniae]|uniref:alpha/beta hydrolase family protein n=1 Tax=Streptomyces avicenniae TaxID=500153 RepID=UPI00069A00EA|nr:alpha/beta fold hydrolase [Streptomyces avicenniae]
MSGPTRVPGIPTDPVATDPPPDARPPAATTTLYVDSGGETLLGVLYLPAGPGPHPVVVLLHGFPGNEPNFDIAQALRRAGYAAVVFHYRGSWGVGGSWSWRNALDDSARVAAAVREPAFAAEHGLDPGRIALWGHSMGGFAALMTAADDPTIDAAVSVAAFDFGTAARALADDPAASDLLARDWEGNLDPLTGTSGAALVAETVAAGQAWSLAGLAPRLADRPLLLIGTGRDTVTPADVHHHPLVAAYLAEPVPRLEHLVLETDHPLSDHRVTLARTTIAFLDRHLKRSP